MNSSPCPHFLIVNLHSTANAGDHALFEVLFEYLTQWFPQARFTLIANDPKSFQGYSDRAEVIGSFFTWLSATRAQGPRWTVLGRLLAGLSTAWLDSLAFRVRGRRIYLVREPRLRAVLDAFYSASLVISCPGNFIYSRAHLAGLPLLGPLSLLVLAWWLRRPFGLAPQTIGPLWRGWERRLVRWILQRAAWIFLRDPISAELLNALRLPQEQFRVLPDLAFLYRGVDEAGVRGLFEEMGVPLDSPGPRLGITLIHWGAQHPRFKGQTQYEDGIAQLIQAFLADHPTGHVFLFPQVCGPTPADDDRIPAQRVWMRLQGLGASSRIHCIARPLPPAVLRSAYHQMDLFVGSRLHSNIFALTGGIPVIAIAYQDKTFGVMRMLGLEEWAMAIEDVDGPKLVERYRCLWAERARWRHRIRNSVCAHMAALEQDLAQLHTELQIALESR